jgi:hypothetical protein
MSTFPWGTYDYRVLPFGLCNSSTTFQGDFLAIFSYLTHDYVEVYMDEFTVYGDDFQQALGNLDKVLIRFRETNLSLGHKKSIIMLTKGIVLGHHIFGTRIRVKPTKIDIISQT